MAASTAMTTVACQTGLSGKRSHLSPRHSTYYGSLSFRLCTEVVYEFLHVHPVYETVDIYLSEAFERHHWNPKHSG